MLLFKVGAPHMTFNVPCSHQLPLRATGQVKPEEETAAPWTAPTSRTELIALDVTAALSDGIGTLLKTFIKLSQDMPALSSDASADGLPQSFDVGLLKILGCFPAGDPRRPLAEDSLRNASIFTLPKFGKALLDLGPQKSIIELNKAEAWKLSDAELEYVYQTAVNSHVSDIALHAKREAQAEQVFQLLKSGQETVKAVQEKQALLCKLIQAGQNSESESKRQIAAKLGEVLKLLQRDDEQVPQKRPLVIAMNPPVTPRFSFSHSKPLSSQVHTCFLTRLLARVRRAKSGRQCKSVSLWTCQRDLKRRTRTWKKR